MKCRVLECKECAITQKYKTLTHKGIDMVASINGNHTTDWVVAHSDGVVVFRQTGKKNDPKAKGNASYGNCIKLKHSDGYYTLYAHMDKIQVKMNQKVKKGDRLGYMANTGRSYGSHLHWEVRDTKDNRINPTPYIDADLPSTKTYYQVYDNVKNKWLPKVKVGSNDYAGNFGHGISGLKIDNLTYRVHDKVKNKWLPYVNGSSSYAGNLPNDIDGVQVKGATYRVHIKGQGWLDWVNKVDDTPQGYAGIFGKTIDAIQIK